ncbi:MAG: hypothetical protein ACLFUA_09565 [Spirochaetales bacterium]
MKTSNRWFTLLASTPGVNADDRTARAAYLRLDRAYTAPIRSYHTWHHVRWCFDRLDRYCDSVATGPDERLALGYAIFYHDAEYDPGAPDNEDRSADLARREMGDLCVPDLIVEVTAALILETRHQPSAAPDRSVGLLRDLPYARSRRTDEADRLFRATAPVMTDVDLSILGARAHTVLAYDRAIAGEYGHLPAQRFREGRRAILLGFLDRTWIYETEFFRSRLETRARRNLEMLVRRFYS